MCLTAYRIDAASPFPQEWNVLGALPGGIANGYAIAYPPERGVDLKAKYPGAGNMEIGWTQVKVNGTLWLHERIQPNNDCVAYAHTYVQSPSERDVTALISTDDGGKLFVNGELLWGVSGVNEIQQDKWQVPVHLKAGWNEVLIKVCQGNGAWGVSFRFNDPKAELKYSTTGPE